MKIRWREHEVLFVTVLVISHITSSILDVYIPDDNVPAADFASAFKAHGASFVYWKNVLLPQIASILLLFAGYLSINFLVLPLLKKISFDDFERFLSSRIIKTAAFILIISYLLALGINICTYYARPHWFNYAGYHQLAIFGYNDSPLTDLFSGFDRALWLVIIFTAVAGTRELVIWLIERSRKREYNILVANNTTSLIFIFLAFLLLNPVSEHLISYITTVTPVFFLYIYLTFWLFPLRGEIVMGRRFFVQFPVPILIRLFLSTFIATLPFIIMFPHHGRPIFTYWAFLLFIVVPICWLLYQQRKEKIMQLRGMEKALARSSTDLQFLRSQINPHFLFNALNTLYGTALKEHSEQTAEGIQRLGDMMRFMLHENNLEFISMEKEIEYLKNYIALQKLRIEASPGIIVEDNLEDARCNRTIAPMLLIPFVENAFKHGISLKEKSWITILLSCVNDVIHFEVRNSVHRTAVNDTEKNNSGIGLTNVRGRLEMLYRGRYKIDISEQQDQFIVKLELR